MVHMDHMDFLIFSWLGHLEFADLHIKCTSTTKTSVLKNFVLPSVSAFFRNYRFFLLVGLRNVKRGFWLNIFKFYLVLFYVSLRLHITQLY